MIRPKIIRTHISLFVSNKEKSARWYEEVIGMETTAIGEHWIMMGFGKKHHDIALIETQLPVFIVVPPRGDLLHDKVLSNLQEVRARGAKTIVLAEDDDKQVGRYADVLIRLPKVSALLQPLVATVPLQMFACELATEKGHDVDQPRNLAKSVTVE